MSVVNESAMAAFRASFSGELILPDDARYESARRVFNAMIDKRPRLIARCSGVADVVAAVDFARKQSLLVAVRGGGHNGGGFGTVDDGLVIDLSAMHAIEVDPQARTVRVEGGATWGEVDRATGAFGLATPSGIASTTGVGGLTLGGGTGHLTRRLGLAIDNLLAVEMVLADETTVVANEVANQDLFWAVRGGGGNFGIVTAFLFRLHPVGTVVAGPTLYPLEMARDAMRFYRDFIGVAPEELNGFFAFLTVPPGPPFPEHLHLEKMAAIAWCYSGPLEMADEALAPARAFGPPAFDGVGPMPHAAWQALFDPIYPPGDQWYWRADFINELTDEAIDLHVEYGSRLPTWKSTTHFYPIDGAASRPAGDATAWAWRGAKWSHAIVGVDSDPANFGLIRQGVVDDWEAAHPYSAGGAYVNFMMDEGQGRVRATYGANYRRLAQIKKRYDPTNFFRVNQNIRPAD